MIETFILKSSSLFLASLLWSAFTQSQSSTPFYNVRFHLACYIADMTEPGIG
jgi:hypothetical protein